jgi:hypothetical protein
MLVVMHDFHRSTASAACDDTGFAARLERKKKRPIPFCFLLTP